VDPKLLLLDDQKHKIQDLEGELRQATTHIQNLSALQLEKDVKISTLTKKVTTLAKKNDKLAQTNASYRNTQSELVNPQQDAMNKTGITMNDMIVTGEVE